MDRDLRKPDLTCARVKKNSETSFPLLLCAGGPWELVELDAERELVCLCRICLRLQTGTVTGPNAFSFLLPQSPIPNPEDRYGNFFLSPFSWASQPLFGLLCGAGLVIHGGQPDGLPPFTPESFVVLDSSWTCASPSLGRSGSLY